MEKEMESNVEEQAPERTTRFISLRTRLLVGFSVVFIIVFAAAFYWFYSFATDMALSRIEEDLRSTLNAAVAGVDGDTFQALAAEGVPREDGYTDDERYWEHVRWLAKVNQIENRALLYSYIDGTTPGTVEFIGSNGAVADPPEGAPFLFEYTPAEGSVIRSGLKELTINMDAYSDQFGFWVSAYAPIKNSAGEIVGGLGTDFKADYVLEVQDAIQDSVVIAFVITYTGLFLLVFLVSGVLSQPMIELTKVAEQIAEGDYEQDLSALYGGRFHDEIDTLARVFETMVDKVREREESLIQQVEELKIEIDSAKRERQVEEIVESTFFGNLQAQAQMMRERRKWQDRMGKKEADDQPQEDEEEDKAD